MIGGAAIAVGKRDSLIMPISAESGNVIILTKPLGTQLATNAYQWLNSRPHLWEKASQFISKEETLLAFLKASNSMSKLNKSAAELMIKYKVNTNK